MRDKDRDHGGYRLFCRLAAAKTPAPDVLRADAEAADLLREFLAWDEIVAGSTACGCPRFIRL